MSVTAISNPMQLLTNSQKNLPDNSILATQSMQVYKHRNTYTASGLVRVDCLRTTRLVGRVTLFRLILGYFLLPILLGIFVGKYSYVYESDVSSC